MTRPAPVTAEDVLTALRLPDTALTDQRIPKKLLLEHGTPTPADRRLIEGHVQELWWHASLKPHTVGIPEYQDAARTYPEIAVLTLTLRGTTPDTSKATRLVELVHRAIPYPLLLITHTAGTTTLTLSVAHKRHSQVSRDDIVLDDLPLLSTLNTPGHPHDSNYLHALDTTQPTVHLHAFYDSWATATLAHAAAPITGTYHLPVDPSQHREALRLHAQLERDIHTIRAAARKERSLARRSDLNLKLQELTRQQKYLITTLGGTPSD